MPKASERKRGLLALSLLGAASGCAASASLSAAPNVDTQGRFGTEERVEVALAFGDPALRLFAAAAAGAGYLGAAESGHVLLLSPEAGFEGGRALRWSAGAFYAPRLAFRGLDVSHGGGASAELLFRVAGADTDDSALALGPRLSAEGVGDVESAAGGSGATGLLHLGLTLRWVAFDKSGQSMKF